jgi:hypothetical protein
MSSEPFLKTVGWFQETAIPRVGEIIQYMPESIFMGTLIISLCAMSNISWWVLLLFQSELIVARRAIGSAMNMLFPTLTQINPNCESGYFIGSKGIKACVLNILGKGGSFPAPGLFFVGGIISYLYSILISFKQELIQTKGEYDGSMSYSDRMITASVLSLVFLLILLMYNVKNGCNTIIGSVTSIGLGMFIGLMLYILNSKLFGKENMNIVGLPILTEKPVELISTTCRIT